MVTRFPAVVYLSVSDNDRGLLDEQAHTVSLKNGTTVTIRLYVQDDKSNLVSERWTSDLTNNTIMMAIHQSTVEGNLNVFQQGWSERLKANGELIIYLHQEFQGVGLGTAMMNEAIRLSCQKGLHRLGLSVIADNRNAIKLYEKVGFQHEGIRRED